MKFLPPAYVVRREGNSFTLFVCPHRGGPGPPRGGYLTGYPPGGSGYPPGGVQVPPPRGGTWLGTPPGGYLTRYPLPPGGLGTPPGGGPGTPPGGVPDRVPPRGGSPGRTTEGVLTTRRAVCLLRSRRRTFLFNLILKCLSYWHLKVVKWFCTIWQNKVLLSQLSAAGFCFRMRCIIPSINLSSHPTDLSEKTSLTFIEFYSMLYQTLLLIHSYGFFTYTKTDTGS